MSPRSSCRWFRRLAGIAAALSVLFLSAGWIDPADRDPRGVEAFWRVGMPRPIAVRDGRATFRLPSRGPTSQTLVIVSALYSKPRAVPHPAHRPARDEGRSPGTGR